MSSKSRATAAVKHLRKPSALPRAARRRLIAALAPARARLIAKVCYPVRSRWSAAVRYAAVLDGHTLSLHAVLPAGVREGFEGRAAQLTVSRRGMRHRVPVRVYRDGDSRLVMDATVLLGADLGGLPVRAGRWRLTLVLRGPSGRKRVPLALAVPPTPYGGPTRPMTTCPRTGMRHRAGRTFTGRLRLVCASPAAQAEVARTELRYTGADVEFRVLGSRRSRWEVEFASAGRSLTRRAAHLGDGLLHVSLPVEEMFPRRRKENWTLYARPVKGGPRIALGRRLHDVRNPLRVFAIRHIVMAVGEGRIMRVQPRYTTAGTLRFTCEQMPEMHEVRR
ncbi:MULTISPECIES: hypothetical protein [unclassified Streptomyces]|uniref:hypothetical protein n=1 Tax=unclassified Streptomyces TaxID=2593676 RepID=UPI00036EE324|nr:MULTISPECIES: hypothetical protein [unclassified Streptomyces]